MIRERDIERLLVKLCRDRHWLCWKFTSPGLRAVPDRIVMTNGRIFFVELKAPGEKPTAAQRRCHELLRARGFDVVVLDSKDAVREWMDG